MTTRDEKQMDAILGDEREIGGWKINPLSPARVAILDRRKNKLVAGGGDQSDLDAAAEVFFVVTREPAQLVAMRRMPADDWLDEVEAFALDLPPDALNEFMAYLQDELEKIAASATAPGEPVEAATGQESFGSSAASASDLPTTSTVGNCCGI